jgi:hypothetical protein
MDELEALLQQIRDLFRTEYVRGLTDGDQSAIDRIMRAARGEAQPNGNHDEREATPRHRPRRRRPGERAPMGAPRAYVDRVLQEAYPGGMSPTEVNNAPRLSTAEALVSFSAIRNELFKGRDDAPPRYRVRDGKYYWRPNPNQTAAETGAHP